MQTYSIPLTKEQTQPQHLSFNPSTYIQTSDIQLSQEVQDKTALIAISGGVDSSVSAALLRHAGVNIKLLFIDSGFLREKEKNNVLGSLKNSGFNEIEVLDLAQKFYNAQKGLILPADKREGFREVYFDAIIDYITKHEIPYLVQGTQFHKDSKIGHNTPTENFLKTKISLIEPVKGLYKDQIRSLAKELDLSPEIIHRMPFPGPGLLIRFGGEYTSEKLNYIREATDVVDTFIKNNNEELPGCYQMFPYLADATEVRYISESGPKLGNIIIVRTVKQVYDGSDLKYAPLEIPYELIEKLVADLMKVPNTARVVIDYTPKNFTGTNLLLGGTIEYQ